MSCKEQISQCKSLLANNLNALYLFYKSALLEFPFIHDTLKVARCNNFVATASIFEYLILKQIDLYGKTNVTHLTHLLHRLNFIMILFFGRSQQILRGNDVTIVFAVNRISALIDLNFGNALSCAYFVCLPSVMQRFTEIYERNFDISWNFYEKGINYA